jgi:PAS domain S-box-containing protein
MTTSALPIKILLVEDDQIDRLAFMRSVKQAELAYDYTIATSLKEAIAIINTQTFQIAILDYNLGDGLSSELFPILKAKNCPFIISTGSGDEETAARLMTEGASDYLIKDPDRNYLKVLPATVNKTLSRQQSDEQLRLLSHAIHSVKDCIFIVNTDGQLLFTNDSLKKLCNLNPDQAIASIEVLGQPQLIQHLTEYTCLDPKQCCNQDTEIALSASDGKELPMLLSETSIQDGAQSIRVGILRDITPIKRVESSLHLAQENLEQMVQDRTLQLQQAVSALQKENQERLQAEEELRNSRNLIQQQQEFLRLVIDSNPNLIFIKDLEGRILLANQAMALSHCMSVEQIVGKTDADLNIPPHESERYAREDRQVITTGESLFLTEEKVYRDGIGERWQQWDKRAIQLPNSSVMGVLAVGVDITDRKRSELVLQKIIEGTASTIGEDFFMALVRHLSEALNIRYALVTELVGDKLQTLGFWGNGDFQSQISYFPARTPCEYALRDGEYFCERQIQELFPEDPDLLSMGADSYLGISLKDDHGNALGNLCILDTQPFLASKRQEANAILKVFAARASAELQRKAALQELNQLNQDLEFWVEQRTRELKEREQFQKTLLDNLPLSVFWKDSILFRLQSKLCPCCGFGFSCGNYR